MATERVTERNEGRHDVGGTYVDKGGSGMSGVIVGIAILALVTIVAFFLLQSSRNDAIRTDAVTSAASSVADSTSTAADAVAPN